MMTNRLANHVIWAEMARRKVQFHPSEQWDEINLWGLFHWGKVRHLLEKGLLLTNMTKENRIIWVKPSREAWESKIKPLVDRYSLQELSRLAGW